MPSLTVQLNKADIASGGFAVSAGIGTNPALLVCGTCPKLFMVTKSPGTRESC